MGGSSARPRPAPPAPDPLPIPVVDNHLHLDFAAAEGAVDDVAAAIAQAAAVGVDRMVQIGCDLPGARFTVDAVQRHPALLGGVSIHPNEAPRLAASGELDAALAEIERLAAHPRVRVIGETGLDYYRTGEEGRPVQHETFRWHIELAKRTGKVLQIHDREAHDDVLRLLDEQGMPERTVLHCFSGGVPFARAALERGCYLSFAGTVTFRNAGGLRDALAVTPLDRVLVETDAPYLTPMPHRGAPNGPYLIPHTLRTMAGVLAVSVPELCERISATSEHLYGPWQPG